MGETINWRERLVAAGVAAPSLADAALCAAVAKGTDARPDAALGPVNGAAINALMLGKPGLPALPPAGLLLVGARVAGAVDLTFGGSREAPLPPLVLWECRGEGEQGLVLLLADASLRALNLAHSVLARLAGERLHVLGETTLQAVRLLPGGSISLVRAELAGALDLVGADLGWGQQAGVRRPAPPASGTVLDCNGARIGAGVFLQQSHAAGRLDFIGASIGGSLDAAGAVLRAEQGVALAADGARVTGGVLLPRLAAEGELRFPGADIGGDLDLGGAQLRQPAGEALTCDRMRLGGDLFLRPEGQRSRVQGQIRLLGAAIGGQVDLRGAALRGPPGQPAVHAENARIAGALLASPAEDGTGCTIQGGLHARGAHCGGGVYLNDAVLRPHADEPDAPVLNLTHASIEQRLDVRGLGTGSRGVVVLSQASVALLLDQDGLAWGEADQGEPQRDAAGHLTGLKLDLDGFTYQRLRAPQGGDWSGREAFLKRQFEGPTPQPGDFKPQPWEQLVKVLRAMGLPQQADTFARKKREFAIECAAERWGARWWSRFVGLTTGHYYSVPRAALALTLYVMLGAALLLGANASGDFTKKRNEVDLARASQELMIPEPSYPPLGGPTLSRRAPGLARAERCWDALGFGTTAEAVATALDLVLPLIDLHADQRCEVDDQAPHRGPWAWLLLVYSVAGWVVSSLAIVTFSGLGRKE